MDFIYNFDYLHGKYILMPANENFKRPLRMYKTASATMVYIIQSSSFIFSMMTQQISLYNQYRKQLVLEMQQHKNVRVLNINNNKSLH